MAGAVIGLRADLSMTAGAFRLALTLDLAPGEVLAVVGPNGAGKTTMLRGLAGLQALDAGRIELGGLVLDDPRQRIRLPPERRPVGMTFQDLRLFPHLSVLENVAFGLRAAAVPRRAAQTKAKAWLEHLGITSLRDRRPAGLSGGEAQLVALARALALEPELLLLDEPLSAVDASARPRLRGELRRELANFAGVALIVTHDPIDALSLGHRLLVLEGGRPVQEGEAAEVAARPRSRWVADLVGTNFLIGESDGAGLVSLDRGGRMAVVSDLTGPVLCTVHPRAVSLYADRPEGSPRNVWKGRVAGIELVGDRVRVRVQGAPSLVAEVTPAAASELGAAAGALLWVAVKATEVEVTPA